MQRTGARKNPSRTALGARLGALFVGLVASGLGAGCEEPPPPGGGYYTERIQPFFTNSCVRQNGPCHLTNDTGVALGNLDLTSFDALERRADAFDSYGPYPVPLLLLKAGEQRNISVTSMNFDGALDADPPQIAIQTDIQHAGGRVLAQASDAYGLLAQWMRNGHTRTGAPPTALSENLGECVTTHGEPPGWDASFTPDATHFAQFRDQVNPVLQRRCAGSSCHGSPVADLHLTCGSSEDELKWNYWSAMEFVAPGANRSTSELLRRPLSTQVGGSFHEGGNVFASVEDDDYGVLEAWIDAAPAAAFPAPFPAEIEAEGRGSERGFRYFIERVQPVLVRSGCTFQNCHSSVMFHDFRIRGGSNGVFGHMTAVRNYEFARDMLALETTDPNESRLIAKNLFSGRVEAGGEGILHRGGALFETFPPDTVNRRPDFATPDNCADVDADAGDLTIPRDQTGYVHPYCVMVRWFEIEREELIAAGRIPSEPMTSIVYVERPAGSTGGGGRPDDFDTFRPGARLVRRDLGLDASGALTALGGDEDLAASCGLGASVDIRGPAQTWDGERIGFAARTSATRGYRLYEVALDGSSCAPVALPSTDDEVAGVRIHDFDPTYPADGRLVFATTRGYLTSEAVGVAGPTRTPARLEPNSNLYVFEDGALRQLTFLLNQEMQPSLMTDGRLIFTSEKREQDFHQLAGRRQNLDGGDYHPLFAQRPSVGFTSATEIVEGLDRNLVLVGGTLDATNGVVDGAGRLIIVNRSIGPDQTDRAATDRNYISSMQVAVNGGVFRSPAPLPNGLILASCADSAPVTNWDLCVIDPDQGTVEYGAVTRLLSTTGTSELEAIAVVPRAPRTVFVSRQDEANGHTIVRPDTTYADILVTDFPMLGTLLFSNTRTSRPIARSIAGFEVWESLPPPAGTTTFAGLADVITDGAGQFYAHRERRGFVSLEADGSAYFRIRGGMAMQLLPVDDAGQPLAFGADAPLGTTGTPLTGQMLQREHMQFYPGEDSRQSMPRGFFNALCAGCHGSITGREVDVGTNVDILTRASPAIQALGTDPVDSY